MLKNRMEKYRYLLKLPCNAGKLHKSIEKTREYSRNYRKRQLEDPEKAEAFKKKKAQQTAEYRKRKKLKLQEKNTETIELESNVQVKQEIDNSKFSEQIEMNHVTTENSMELIKNIKTEPEANFFCILPQPDESFSELYANHEIKTEPEINYNLEKNLTLSQVKPKNLNEIESIQQNTKDFPRKSIKTIVCIKKTGNSIAEHVENSTNHIGNPPSYLKISSNFENIPENQRYLQNSLVEFEDSHKSPLNFRCLVCNRIFKSNEKLTKHLKNHESNEPKGIQSKDTKEFNINSSESKIECQFCQKLVKKQYFNRHVKRHDLKKAEKEFSCENCGKKFSTKTLLRGHKLIHKKVECDICGFRTAEKRVLEDHFQWHLDPEAYKCGTCGKQLANKKSLFQHTKQIHGKHEGDFYCSICNKKCRNRTALQKHESRIHQPPKTCQICGKTVCHVGFNVHMKTHVIQNHKNQEKIKS